MEEPRQAEALEDEPAAPRLQKLKIDSRPRVTAKIGETVTFVGIEGVEFRVVHVNEGKRRISIQPVDDSTVVRQAPADPKQVVAAE